MRQSAATMLVIISACTDNGQLPSVGVVDSGQIVSFEAQQPGSTMWWLRCPVGQDFTEGTCVGRPLMLDWEPAQQACPLGYRLPTREEFVGILGDCDAGVVDGGSGNCDACAASDTCVAMFGADEGGYWSSTLAGVDVRYAWVTFFGNGLLYNEYVNFEHQVHCARSE